MNVEKNEVSDVQTGSIDHPSREERRSMERWDPVYALIKATIEIRRVSLGIEMKYQCTRDDIDDIHRLE